MIQWGVIQLSATNCNRVTEVFLELALLFPGQIKYLNIKDFWTMFCHKTRVSSLYKVPKNTVSSGMGIMIKFI